MNKRATHFIRYIFIFIFIVALVGAAIILSDKEDTTDQAPSTITSVPSTSSNPEPNNDTINQQLATQEDKGQYITYDGDNIASNNGETYLFFHAPWCSQCRSVESGIIEQGVPDGIRIIKIDYDSNQDLRQKYGVTLQTTFVKVTTNGDFIDKYVAYQQPTFDAVKNNFIQ